MNQHVTELTVEPGRQAYFDLPASHEASHHAKVKSNREPGCEQVWQ